MNGLLFATISCLIMLTILLIFFIKNKQEEFAYICTGGILAILIHSIFVDIGFVIF